MGRLSNRRSYQLRIGALGILVIGFGAMVADLARFTPWEWGHSQATWDILLGICISLGVVILCLVVAARRRR